MSNADKQITITGPVMQDDPRVQEMEMPEVNSLLFGKSVKTDEKGPEAAVLALRVALSDKTGAHTIIADDLDAHTLPEVRRQAIELVQAMEATASAQGLPAEQVIYWLRDDVRDHLGNAEPNFPDTYLALNEYSLDAYLGLDDVPKEIGDFVDGVVRDVLNGHEDENWITEEDLEAVS